MDRLLVDENTSHRLVSACQRLVPNFPIVHIAKWDNGAWLGLDDPALLISCEEANLILVAFDRSTLAWHAGQLMRAGKDHAGVVLFRGTVRTVDYGFRWCPPRRLRAQPAMVLVSPAAEGPLFRVSAMGYRTFTPVPCCPQAVKTAGHGHVGTKDWGRKQKRMHLGDILTEL